MNDTNETILIQIKVSEEEIKEKMVAVRKELASFNAELANLKKQQKDGKITAEALARAEQQIAPQIAAANAVIRDGSKTLADYAKSQKAAEGSLNQMKAQVALLTPQYYALSKAEKESTSGRAMRDHIREISDTLKDEQEALGKSNKSITAYIRDINIMGINVGEVSDKFSYGSGGVQAFAKSILTARGAATALIAVPIVAALVGIIAFFKSTDEGADKLEQAIAGLTTGFSYLAKGIAPIGKRLYDAFFNRDEFLKKLKDGTDEYTVSLGQVATSALRAGQAQAAYTKTMQDLEDAEDDLIAQREKVGLQVDQALLKTKDRSLSEKQKISILQEAGKAEADLATKTVKNARIAYDAVVKLNRDKQRAMKLSDDERRDQIKQELTAQAELIKAQRESLNTQQAIRNRETAQEEQAVATRKEQAEKAKQAAKDAAQEQAYLAEYKLVIAKRDGKETLKLQEDLIRKQAAVELVGLKKNSNQRKLILAKMNAEILKQNVDAAIQADEVLFTTQEDKLNARLSLARKGSDEELNIQKELLGIQLDKQKSALVDAAQKQDQTVANQKALRAKLLALDAKYNADVEALDVASDQRRVNASADLEEKRLQTNFDLGKQSLADQHKLAADRIDLEEKTQLELLKIEEESAKARGLLDEKLAAELLVRQNAIQAKAIKARKDLTKQEEIDAANTAKKIADTRVLKAEEGTKEQHLALLDQIEKDRAAGIAGANGVQEDIDEINAEADKRRKQENERRIKEQITKYLTIAQNALSLLSAIGDAQAQRSYDELDKQQKASMKLAGSNVELREKLEEQYAKKKEQLDKKEAERKKKYAIA